MTYVTVSSSGGALTSTPMLQTAGRCETCRTAALTSVESWCPQVLGLEKWTITTALFGRKACRMVITEQVTNKARENMLPGMHDAHASKHACRSQVRCCFGNWITLQKRLPPTHSRGFSSLLQHVARQRWLHDRPLPADASLAVAGLYLIIHASKFSANAWPGPGRPAAEARPRSSVADENPAQKV